MLNVLNLWRMRNISLEGKIIIFKILALSKIVYLSLITSFSKQLIEEIQIIQKAFIWKNLTLTFPSLYKQLSRNWRNYLSYSVNIPSSVLSQPIWYNKNIKINSKPIYVEEFAKKISFSYMIFSTLKMNLKRGMK